MRPARPSNAYTRSRPGGKPPFFTPRERAALAWTEAITNIQQGHASDEEFEAARKHFDEAELVKLTVAITQINTWNRIAIAFRAEPGKYEPKTQA